MIRNNQEFMDGVDYVDEVDTVGIAPKRKITVARLKFKRRLDEAGNQH